MNSTSSQFFSTELTEPAFLNGTIDRFRLPLHLISTRRVRGAFEAFQDVVRDLYPKTQVMFAVKSNPCRGAVKLMRQIGVGIDAVSEYELRAALLEQIPSSRIVCNGNAKSDAYIKMAVAADALIAVDSFEELQLVAAEAGRTGMHARVLARVSGLNLDGFTSFDQSTAASWTKFGIPASSLVDFFSQARRLGVVEAIGISAHIGTQVCDPTAYERLAAGMVSLAVDLKQAGHRVNIIDFGGGYPLNYLSRVEWDAFEANLREQLQGNRDRSEHVTWGDTTMGFAHLKGNPPTESDVFRGKAYWSPTPGAEMFRRVLEFKLDSGFSIAERLKQIGEPTLLIEPGRALIGPAGVTACRVVSVKEVEGNSVVVADIGIVNHGTVLVTPDIYPMMVWPPQEDDRPFEAFVAGRLCFTGDMISKVKIRLNREPKRGDILLIGLTGAYSADHFASNSCGFPRPAKVALTEDGALEIWRRGETFDDVFRVPEVPQ